MKRNTDVPQTVEKQAEDAEHVLVAIAYLDWEFEPPPKKKRERIRNGTELVASLWVLIATALASFTFMLVRFLR
jgi:hypothetical protein